jgi:hypothetical protein
MALIADAFQPFMRSEFFSVSGRPELSTFTDLITHSKAGFDLDFDVANQSISLDFRDSNVVIDALAGDCCRFSLASFQSIAHINDDILDRDGAAWSMTKLYYSAFYAGHAVIRLLGEACSFFDQHHTGRIRRLGNAIGKPPPFAIEGGLYKCSLSRETAELTCLKFSKGAIGSGHELFWEFFGNKMKSISEEMLNGPLVQSEAQAVYSQIEDFRLILQKARAYNWLSSVRNDLQYRHKFEVWYPYSLSKNKRQILHGLTRKWVGNPMSIDLRDKRVDILGEFTSCCVFIVALCRCLLEKIAEGSSAGKRSFVTLAPIAFLRDRRHGIGN